ncbi:hypothetical protein [Paracidovorax konjaci]|uniref:Uncharacterized protein n=1 Tax=Paracidovorax konjaci TaxID=32040 RepID=A0A1I1ZN27_9BURK|nr:hypothetical protein [Paracidovorax konjaci]SFE32758.1 hypothetical protein SAMN04489710_1315 [Paracidovorax konjaci]
MNILVCNVPQAPCPPDQQALLTFTQVEDFAALGITSEVVATAYVFGASSVVLWWFCGYCIALAIKAVSKA